jgi:hypothetical protein
MSFVSAQPEAVAAAGALQGIALTEAANAAAAD